MYGLIPQTFCGAETAELCAIRTGRTGIEGDGDPMDICVLTERPFAHGNVFLRARPIGGLRMIDGKQADDKIIAVLEDDIVYGEVQDIQDCPAGLIDRLRHYFLSYKQLPGDAPRKVEIADVYNRSEASEVIKRSIRDYNNRFGNPAERLAALRKLLP